jgi:hypothetical protein
MKRKLLLLPLFPFLLPLFFVLHGVADNAGNLAFRDCYDLLMIYMAVTAVLYALLYLIYRDHCRTALALGALQGVFFFFGALHGILNRYVPFLSRYRILLAILTALLITIWIRLKKSTFKPGTPVLFINLLFLIYIIFDLLRLLLPGDRHQHNLSVSPLLSAPSQGSAQLSPPPSPDSVYPDVYLLLMDEYASTSALKTYFRYNNGSLDSFLTQAGFRTLPASHSNYNFTSFSMASMLNLSYIGGLGNECTISDYASCNKLIRDCQAVQLFSSHGYDIINFSIFDLGGQPSAVNEPLLPVKTNLITAQTLFDRIRRDIGWNINSFGWLRKQAYRTLENNNGFIAGVENTAGTKSQRPRFIYTHLEMPHNPFYFDKNGRLKEPKEMKQNIEGYLDYLPYTNAVIKKLVNTIQNSTHRSAVILLMGDHGVRYPAPDNRDPNGLHYFQNMNAVFFPDGDYHLFYDSISSVNEFRVVFTKLFKEQLPLLKDSTTLLHDRQN